MSQCVWQRDVLHVSPLGEYSLCMFLLPTFLMLFISCLLMEVTNMFIALLRLLSWAIHGTSRWAVLLHTTFLHYKTVVFRTRTFLTALRDRLMEKGPIDDSSNN